MTYYPKMSYRMVSLEKPLAPGYGLGDLPQSAWCSTANRQGSCSPISGVCLPMNAATLAVFKDLQRQTNRILARLGKSLIGVDGRIGPSTVNAVADAMQSLGALVQSADVLAMGLQWSNVRGKPCDLIAAHADQIAAKLATVANGLAAPVVADPGKSKPSQPSTTGGVVHPPASDIVASASPAILGFIPPVIGTPLGIAALVVGGLAFRKAFAKPKRGGRARGKRRAPARRRAARRRRR